MAAVQQVNRKVQRELSSGSRRRDITLVAIDPDVATLQPSIFQRRQADVVRTESTEATSYVDTPRPQNKPKQFIGAKSTVTTAAAAHKSGTRRPSLREIACKTKSATTATKMMEAQRADRSDAVAAACEMQENDNNDDLNDIVRGSVSDTTAAAHRRQNIRRQVWHGTAPQSPGLESCCDDAADLVDLSIDELVALVRKLRKRASKAEDRIQALEAELHHVTVEASDARDALAAQKSWSDRLLIQVIDRCPELLQAINEPCA